MRFLIRWTLNWIIVSALIVDASGDEIDYEQLLEKKLMNGYNSKARPVKNEETVVRVTVYLNIAHVEKIDEKEQTMLVHGHLWASWTDEYLQWKPNNFNGTKKVQIQAWRIWQPALSLYNSAKGNAWHLYMHGLPATIYSTGRVWASGTYSFYVTCQFDFTNWPFDTQKCPIVIADWVYGLAQVNLSDPEGTAEYMKPTIRLSYDPVEKTNNKKHVGGWEIKNSWKKHCYWGPKGCKEEQPEGELEWYWSLLEFGVIIERHVPYLGSTLFIPLALTTILILSSFWIETFSVTIGVIIFTLALQGVCGWEMISNMPPGSGTIPKIIQLYSLNLLLTTGIFAITVLFKFIQDNFPEEYVINIGFDILEMPNKLKMSRIFETSGMSFDPQELLLDDQQQIMDVLENGSISSTSIGMSDAFDSSISVEVEAEHNTNSDEMLIPINLPTNPSSSSEQPALESVVSKIEGGEKLSRNGDRRTKLELQLYTIKRFIFVFYFIIYLVSILFCFIF